MAPYWRSSSAWAVGALVCFFPILKALGAAGILPSRWMFPLFYGGGLALSAWAVTATRTRPLLAPLLARPLRGAWDGIWLFCALLALAALLLLFPPVQPMLSGAVYGLLTVFDPFTIYFAAKTGDWGAPLHTYLLHGGGALAEEWIFRGVLLWVWLHRPGAAPPYLTRAETWGKVLALNAYFALLHLPQGWEGLPAALLGGVALSVLLLRRPNLWLVGTLHLLYNWKLLVG